MFYSLTLLAQKGPLSTVWIAAHLKHRLKKSHHTSTHIPSIVKHIMDPGVPIALRLSAHLLLGVVRIYSKKVDYLSYDCHLVLTCLSKSFAFRGASDAQVCRGKNSPDLVLCSSPPIQQPQQRGMKRKQFFDEPIVLTNRFMRGALNNSCDIPRRKKHFPSPTHPIPEEPRAATPPVTAPDMEIEHLCSIAATPPPTIPAHNMDIELNIEGNCRSPIGRDDMTPFSAQKLRSVSVSPLRTNIASETMQTPDLASSPGARGSEMETPMIYLDDTFQNFGLPDTHQLINSPETEDLCFLEMENNTPASSQGTCKSIGTLSMRTRAVAQYLKTHSPITPILEDPAGDLSLNKILKGKTRKHSACLFFEVLVLKTNGLVDIQQEGPCGDISLKLTATL